MPWMPGSKRNNYADEFALVPFILVVPLAVLGLFLAVLATAAYFPFGWVLPEASAFLPEVPKGTRIVSHEEPGEFPWLFSFAGHLELYQQNV